MPSDRPGIAPPLPASGRPTQPRSALERCHRRTRHPAKPLRAMVRGFARKPSRGHYRRRIAGDHRSRPRRTDRHRATARLRARLRQCRCLTKRTRLCTDHICPAGAATPADFNRNSRPTSIGMGGRLQSECPADIIGIRNNRDWRDREARQSLGCAQVSDLCLLADHTRGTSCSSGHSFIPGAPNDHHLRHRWQHAPGPLFGKAPHGGFCNT